MYDEGEGLGFTKGGQVNEAGEMRSKQVIPSQSDLSFSCTCHLSSCVVRFCPCSASLGQPDRCDEVNGPELPVTVQHLSPLSIVCFARKDK